jgi:photosystem II stability/assembly factor-like uncharacterized protein
MRWRRPYVLLLLVLLSSPLKAQWKPTSGPYGGTANCFTQIGDRIFLGTAGSIYESTDSGASWHDRSVGIRPNSPIISFAGGAAMLYAAATDAIYRSDDTGLTWKKATCSGLTQPFAFSGFGGSRHAVFASYKLSAYRSSDAGEHWGRVDTGLMNLVQPKAIASVGDTMYIAGSWITRSTDQGLSWSILAVPAADSSWGITRLAAFNDLLLAYDSINGVLRSTDAGRSWQRTMGGPKNLQYPAVGFTRVGSDIYFAKQDHLYRSTNLGASWITPAANPYLTSFPNAELGAIGAIGNALFVSYNRATLFRSLDSAKHWAIDVTGINGTAVNTVAATGDTLLAGTDAGLAVSANAGADWTLNSLPLLPVSSLLIEADTWYAGFRNVALPKIFRTMDRGQHWIAIDTPALRSVECIFRNDSILFAGGASEGNKSPLVYSSDEGHHWTGSLVTYHPMTVHAVAGAGPNLVTATSLGLFFSDDSGVRWWEDGSFGASDVSAMAAADSVLFCAFPASSLHSGIQRSYDHGANWEQVNRSFPYNGRVTAFCSWKNFLFAATDSNGIAISNDYGAHWQDVSEGLHNLNITSLVIQGSNLVAGTASSGVWRRPLAEMIASSVRSEERATPEFTLAPNPVSQVLHLTLRSDNNDDIIIFNAMGSMIERVGPTTSINVSALPAGFYWCKCGMSVVPLVKR